MLGKKELTRAGAILIALLALLMIFLVLRPDPEPPVPTGEQEVELYFATPDAMYLKPETRIVPGEDFYYEVLGELIAGPQEEGLVRTIPEGTEIREIVRENETAYLDFNNVLRDQHPGGSAGERMTVYSIVNTMTAVPGIQEVYILIEGEEIETLAGHMDLTLNYTFNYDIVEEENEEYQEEIEEFQEENREQQEEVEEFQEENEEFQEENREQQNE